MNAKDIAIAQLRIDEGLRLKAYQCTAGKWTLGYGRNLEAHGMKPAIAKLATCTKDTAEAWLLEDVDKVIADCARTFTLWHPLNDVRQAVLINMAYNMGAPGVAEFSCMFDAIHAGNYEHAADEMRHSKWAKQVGARAERLALQMLSGA